MTYVLCPGAWTVTMAYSKQWRSTEETKSFRPDTHHFVGNSIPLPKPTDLISQFEGKGKKLPGPGCYTMLPHPSLQQWIKTLDEFIQWREAGLIRYVNRCSVFSPLSPCEALCFV